MRALAPLLALGLMTAVARADSTVDGGTAAPPRVVPPPPASAFVRVAGTRFVVGAEGRPFVFVGANANALQGELVRARYRETLAALRSDGLTVARIWAFAEGPADAGEWYRKDHLFRAGPDGYLEPAYRHLDAVVAEAEKLGLRLIVTLSNNWGDYGGIPMYLRWAGLPVGDGPDDPVRERFYTDDKVRAFFEDGVARLLLRTNTVSGRRYAEDPTILSWELMNESTVVTPSGRAARRDFLARMARFIRARDPHHLIAPGLGGYATRDERRDWIEVHRLPEFAYCDGHLYLEQEPRVRSRKALFDQVDDRAQLARFVLGKPLVIGEFGFRTDLERRFLRARRDAWFRRLLGRALDDGVAGALAWIYQPWSGKARDFGIYVDRADTDDVRAAMRELAARAAAAPAPTNARLGPALGDRFLYQPLLTLPGREAPQGRVRRRGEALTVEIDPRRFHEARFERAGVAAGAGGGSGSLPHLYGAGFGQVSYRFEAPPLPAGEVASITVRARLSSEWPGAHAPAPGSPGPGSPAAEGGSRVVVRLDGAEVGRLRVPADDGRGAWREVTVRDAALRARLAAAGVHTLTFEVPDAPGSQGLCVYGRAKRRAAAGTARGGETAGGPIEVRYVAPGPRPAAEAKAPATSPS